VIKLSLEYLKIKPAQALLLTGDGIAAGGATDDRLLRD
jgi:hypothetical protein